MIIIADTPAFILKKVLAGKPVRTWMYLGQREEVLLKFQSLLSADAKLLDYAPLLNDLSDQKRAAFVAWIDSVARDQNISREWFFSVPSVKNPTNSSLFLQVCYFFVLKKTLESRRPDLIVVDSTALARMIVRHFSQIQSNACNAFASTLNIFKAIARGAGRYGVYMARFLDVFISARSVFKNRARKLLENKKRIVLIRNYITGEFTDNPSDTLEKRYFPGLYAFILKNGMTPIFLPIAVQTKNYRDLFTRVRASDRNIVFVEEFLKWSDYAHLALAPVRAAACRLNPSRLDGIDFSPLMKEEYYAHLTEHGFLLAVLCSRLGQRLKNDGIVPESIVNWSEYQAFEKGLLAGLRAAFQDIRIIAAHPFCIPPNHLCLIPSQQEKLLNILPNRSLVLGLIGKDVISQYLEDIPISFTPLFRYAGVHRPHVMNPKANDVLVLFGFSLANAIHSLKILISLSETLNIFDRVLIKLHPLANFDGKTLAAELGQPLPESFEFIDGNLEDHLSTVAVGICGATGTAVELAVRGIPVIIVAETRALTMNYLAYRQDPDLWKLCYNQQDFDQALKHFYTLRTQHPQRLKVAAESYLKAYFAREDQDVFNNLL